jgi:hypothetical protein
MEYTYEEAIPAVVKLKGVFGHKKKLSNFHFFCCHEIFIREIFICTGA